MHFMFVAVDKYVKMNSHISLGSIDYYILMVKMKRNQTIGFDFYLSTLDTKKVFFDCHVPLPFHELDVLCSISQ